MESLKSRNGAICKSETAQYLQKAVLNSLSYTNFPTFYTFVLYCSKLGYKKGVVKGNVFLKRSFYDVREHCKYMILDLNTLKTLFLKG